LPHKFSNGTYCSLVHTFSKIMWRACLHYFTQKCEQESGSFWELVR
jgi:hypothetical protein